jgi:hypothetical protein
VHLAYLISRAVDDDSWTGGLLITDGHGLPVDFRYVDPIRPTRLQRLIYGGALKRYLVLDAIAGTLLKAANSKVDWIFTADPVLLELEGPANGRFVVVSNGSHQPLSEAGDFIVEDVGKILLQVTSAGQPTSLAFNAANEADTERIAGELASLSSELDFTEPLERVGEALSEICQTTRD